MNNQPKLRELLRVKLKLMRLRRKRLLLSALQKPRRIYQHNIAKTGEIRVRNRRQRNVTTPRGSSASLFENSVFLHSSASGLPFPHPAQL